LLSILADIAANEPKEQRQGFDWISCDAQKVRAATPFWDDRDIVRLSRNLHAKGVLLLGPYHFGGDQQFRFAFNERLQTTQKAAPPAGKNFIGGNWQPDADTLAQIAQHNIPERFALDLLPEFVTYWRERADAQRSWGAKFIQHVIRNWRQFEAKQNRLQKSQAMEASWRPSEQTMGTLVSNLKIDREFIEDRIAEFVSYWRESGRTIENWDSQFINQVTQSWRQFEQRRNNQSQASPMYKSWQPSPDAQDMLATQFDVPKAFWYEAIPEFIFYWMDVGDAHKNWNAKFVQHVRMQWKRYNASMEHSTDPRPISANWQPSADFYEVLRLSNINAEFAQSKIAEFVLFWKESNQLHTSWDSRFLKHVKREWANSHSLTQTTDNRSTRDISIEEELTDRSWAF